jgi:hypothetical protein
MLFHHHRQGQLILALHGAVTCTAADGLWIVPPSCGVWIPGGVPHSNRPTPNARLAYLFVEPGAAAMPQNCCTLSISPMVREMVLRLADAPTAAGADDHFGRLARVLLDELTLMPGSGLLLPTSAHPKIAMVTALLAEAPADRRPLREWAKYVGMSERSFKRLMVQETGLSSGDGGDSSTFSSRYGNSRAALVCSMWLVSSGTSHRPLSSSCSRKRWA